MSVEGYRLGWGRGDGRYFWKHDQDSITTAASTSTSARLAFSTLTLFPTSRFPSPFPVPWQWSNCVQSAVPNGRVEESKDKRILRHAYARQICQLASTIALLTATIWATYAISIRSNGLPIYTSQYYCVQCSAVGVRGQQAWLTIAPQFDHPCVCAGSY